MMDPTGSPLLASQTALPAREPSPTSHAAPTPARGGSPRGAPDAIPPAAAHTAPARWVWVTLAGLGALAAVAVVMMLWWPLGYDQTIFAMNGATTLAGGVPYRDAWETRGPLSFYLFAGIEALFGRTAVTIRAFDILLLAGANVMLWRLLRRFAGRVAAAFTLVLWTLSFVSFTFNETAQPDVWVAYAVLGSIVAVLEPPERRAIHVLTSGALIGACALLKPFYAGFLLAPALVVALGRPRARLVAGLAQLVAGAAVPVVAVLGTLAATGGLAAFVDVHLLYNLRVYSGVDRVSTGTKIRLLLEFLWKGKIIVAVIPAALVGLHELWRRARPLACASAVVLLIGTGCVLAQGKFFFYHWAPVLVMCVPLAGIGLAAAARSTEPAARALVFASIATIAYHAMLRPLTYLGEWGSYMVGRQSAEQYYHAFGKSGWVVPADQQAAARFLARATPPGAPVGVWGADAGVPYLAHRPVVSRFPSTIVLVLATKAPITQDYRREYVRAVTTERPMYLVVGLHREKEFGTPPPIAETFPELGAVVARDYTFDRHFGDIDLYRRKDLPAVP